MSECRHRVWLDEKGKSHCDCDVVQVQVEDLAYRLRKRAEIRRVIPTRKSVQEGQPDRLADLLDEAAIRIEAMNRAYTEGWYSCADVPPHNHADVCKECLECLSHH